jgi:uncharacterized protein (TIGR02118 family)
MPQWAGSCWYYLRYIDPKNPAAFVAADKEKYWMPVDLYVIKEGTIPRNAVKNIEFVNRRPGMALAPFRAYWRNTHGPIASKIAVIHRYEQNHLKLSAYDNGNPPYDGLAITWFASTADMKLGTTTREYQLTRADEPNFLPDGHLPIIIVRERVI